MISCQTADVVVMGVPPPAQMGVPLPRPAACRDRRALGCLGSISGTVATLSQTLATRYTKRNRRSNQYKNSGGEPSAIFSHLLRKLRAAHSIAPRRLGPYVQYIHVLRLDVGVTRYPINTGAGALTWRAANRAPSERHAHAACLRAVRAAAGARTQRPQQAVLAAAGARTQRPQHAQHLQRT